jgi:predicted DNA-binding transcriptional regulator YafY
MTIVPLPRQDASRNTLMTQPVDPDISGAARGYWSLQIRAAQFIQMLLDQQETDNGVRPWMTKERIADDLGVTTRTITEMMSRLRELGVPANYVRKREGIGFTGKVTSFPALVCTQHESMGLCIAMLGLSVHSSMPYTAGVRSIAIKLTAGLRKELAVEFEALESAISFHCIGADIFIRPINFEVVTPAIIYRQELQIEYAKPSEGGLDDGARDSEPGSRRIEPLHLACIDFGWYLLAWDPKDEMVKTFALRRIRDIRMTGVTCPPREFDAKKQLRHCFGAFGGKKAETVRLRFPGTGQARDDRPDDEGLPQPTGERLGLRVAGPGRGAGTERTAG